MHMTPRQPSRLITRLLLVLSLVSGILLSAVGAGATALPQGIKGTLTGAGQGAIQGTLMIEPLDSATDMYDGYSMSGSETPGECQYPCRFYDTASDGSFNVPLAPGEYWIRFAAQGWASEWWGSSSVREGSEVTITAGAYVNQGVELVHGGSVSGTIAQAEGVHDGWVEVWVADSSFPGGYFLMKTAWADANGDYSVPNLPDAAYRVHFVNKLTKLEGWWHDKATIDAANPVTVTGGENVPAIDPELVPFGTFTGQVTRAVDGAAVGGVNVDVYRETEPFHWTLEPDHTVTAPDGTYTLPVRSGTYRVHFYGPTDLKSEYWINAGHYATGNDVLVALGEQTTGVNIALEPTTILSKGTPTVYGIQRVGHTVTATNGSWYPTPNEYTYKWTHGSTVLGYGKTYTLRGSDFGHVLRVYVTATRYTFLSATRHADTGTIGRGTLRRTSRAELFGARLVGSYLHAVAPTTSPTSIVRYRWLRDGRRIIGQTGSHYRLVAADRGHRMSVQFVLRRAAYTTLVVTITTGTAVR